jgi:hypothetical protein
MKQFIKNKNIGLALIVALALGPSCSEENPDFTINSVFEHTFHCLPTTETFGMGVRMTHILDVSSNPELLAYREKINSILVDSVRYSFSIPGDNQVYEVTHSTTTACPYDPTETDTWTVGDCWPTTYVSPLNYENFLDFQDGQQGTILISNSNGALGRSFLKHQKVFMKVIFYFEDTDLGYPISNFDFTMKFYVTLREQNDDYPD